MKTILHPITVRDLYDGYVDKADAGVVALDGRLDVRPPYQREFVYKPAQEKAVIDTVLKGAPLSNHLLGRPRAES